MNVPPRDDLVGLSDYAERCALACSMMAGEITPIAELSLSQSHFRTHPHRLLFAAIEALEAMMSPPDATHVVEYLEGRGEYEAIGGDDGLRAIIDAVPPECDGWGDRFAMAVVRLHSAREAAETMPRESGIAWILAGGVYE